MAIIVTLVLALLLVFSVIYYLVKCREGSHESPDDESRNPYMDEIGIEKHPRTLNSDFEASKRIIEAVLNDSKSNHGH